MLEITKKELIGYKFIDLFSGIGGFHYALKSFGAECVFASEWDVNASKTYFDNFNLYPHGDITKIKESDIPKHNILCGGFPCQSFSISGKQKGFDDIRGNLFFDIIRIAEYHLPEVIFLENVKNLINHNNGHTFNIVIRSLEKLQYEVYYKVFNTSNFGLPQNRERIYIVAFRKDLQSSKFKFPIPPNNPVCLQDILDDNSEDLKVINRDDINIYKHISDETNLFDYKKIINKPIQIGKVNKGGQGERIYHPYGHAITLSAHGGGVGSKTGLYLINGQVRKLTPRECARLQGFPENFIFGNSKSQSYKQFGNSVSINVLQFILFEIVKIMRGITNGKS